MLPAPLIEVVVALSIIVMVVVAGTLAPSLGVQTGLTGITILLSLRKGSPPPSRD